MKKLKWSSLLIIILCTTMIISSFTVYGVTKETFEKTITQEDHQTTTSNISSDYSHIYTNDGIHIYNIEQLKAIGSNQKVKDLDNNSEQFGLGKDVVVEGETITYSLDANYILENDIDLNGEVWRLPKGFTGSFTKVGEDSSSELYDEQTDTIYIYNSYQLDLIQSDKSSLEPVLSQDYDVTQFGQGQLIYPDGSQSYLTYSNEHHYVLSKNFTASRPMTEAIKAQKEQEEKKQEIEALADNKWENAELSGRDYIGQVYKEINGVKYILIGNEQQLRAIGSNESVTPTLFIYKKTVLGSGTYTPLYPGDADFNTDITYDGDKFKYYDDKNNSNKLMHIDYSVKLLDAVKNILGGILGAILGDSEIVGYNYETNMPDKTIDETKIKSEYSNLKYSSDANYIIFRDIDLNNVDWKPLMFSGTMVGAISKDKNDESTLWNDSGIVNTTQPIISNITVNQTSPIETKEQSGVGFFGSIISKSTQTIGVVDKSVSVKNIKLQNVSVTNATSDIVDHTGLIQGILDLLDKLLPGLLGNLGEVLGNLLNPNGNGDPSVFATGSFAGRISGDVTVEDCVVENVTNISNINDLTGGFVGQVEGITEYDGLQKILKDVAPALEKILNIIPYVDLGTLIKVLLDGNIIDLNELIPTGYKSPTISNCHLDNSDKDLSVGNEAYNFQGGFVGKAVGTKINNTSIKANQLTVAGNNMAGGFAGYSANAELVGVLNSLGIELFNAFQLNTFLLNTRVETTDLKVHANEKYSGGISGALANSFVVDCSVSGTTNITANSYAGGISGIAALGQSISLSGFYSGKKDLMGLVGGLLGGITSGETEKENILLSLGGISPSVLAGNEITGSLTVQVNENYAGGMVGQADGVKILSSSHLEEKSYIWKKMIENKKLNYTVLGRNNTISNLKEIFGQSHVGGVIGEAKTASAGGILNATLGIGNFLGFEIENTTVSSIGTPGIINATQDYAGGFAGKAMGGTVLNVKISELQKVEANNYAGGFIGYGGTGSFAETKALNILGLDFLKITNLLNLASGLVLEIENCDVQGTTNGFTVKALGSRTSDVDISDYYAGGFIGKSTSVRIRNSQVKRLKDVTADEVSGYAGGFAGATKTGGLADAADGNTNAFNGLEISGLLSAAPYLVSDFKNTTVDYQPDADAIQVSAAYAGGFIGEMQSGYVDNEEPYAVSNISNVQGSYYAGGFAGKIYSGGLATAGDLSVLNGLANINVSELLSVLNVYIPIINSAGVSSNELVVEVTSINKDDSNSGSAGGYVGYGSGLKISNSQVNQLKHTLVNPPSDLNSDDGSSYFSDQSKYAINGLRYAGGYVGKLDIGSSASLGSGLGVLKDKLGLNLNDVTQALEVVASQIENSDVYGAVGGYSVKADFKDENDKQGNAGGYAGSIDGSSLQNCNAYNFEYIIGQEAAGGYVGKMQPGNVASVVGETDILGGILSVEKDLLSVIQSFIPMVYNSETTSVPCGGVVRADAASDETRERGLAGGYVGHNLGGRIEGMSVKKWNDEVPKVLKENAAVRIRNVYGYEFSGGFSGRSDSANGVDTGNLSILFDFIKISNPLSALSAIYFTESNTAVYGPLRKLTVEVWNAWVDAVGIKGAYGQQLQALGKVDTQDQLDEIIEKYAYGYDVKAARKEAGILSTQGGSAGGYVGRMEGGKITSAQANDIKLVTAYRSSGGFVGEMTSASVVNVGGIQLGDFDVIGNLGVLETFVPIIETSSAVGYKSGATIIANGTDLKNQQGNAGGFAGIIIGGQIKGNENDFCSIEKLKTVKGTNTIGGFAGSILSGSAANVDVGSNSGLLPKLLKPILGNTDKLASLLNATVSTIKYAKVDAWDNWGITIDGRYQKENDPNTQYTYASGGFVGNMSGAVLGDKDSNNHSLIVNNIKKVIGGEHVGGFFGLADVAAVAEVGDNESNTILGLIKIGELDVLDAFRTYVYHASVNGATDGGLSVSAHTQTESGVFESTVQTGNAGGFGGSLLNGSVKNSSVTNLNQVDALNYTGGFIGHLGKSGVIDLDSEDTLNGLLKTTAGVLDNFGSHCDECTVDGIKDGFIVNSQNGKECISGGFAGLADLAKIDNSHVTNIKKVNSDQIAGGYVGRTTFSYLAEIHAGSGFNNLLLDNILKVVNKLLDILYVDDLENLGAIDIGLGKLLEVKLLSDGKTLSVTLLGLPISVALVKNNGDGTSDLAQIHIGDTYIEVPCTNTEGDHISDKDKENIKIGLVKSNRTSIKNSSITGISIGYDVFGGKASDEKDGTHQKGYAGGFVGYNVEGLFENNQMYYADTIRGTQDKVGPFAGVTSLNSNYEFNDVKSIEGNQNIYRVYRDNNDLTSLIVNDKTIQAELSNSNWNEFVISHINDVQSYDKFKSAILSSVDINKEAEVYISSAKAVLMKNEKATDNEENLTPPPSDMQDPCDELINLTINKIWKDFGNFDKKRPSDITLYLTRSYQQGDGVVPDDEFKQTIILTPSVDMKNIWQKIVNGLDAYKELDDGTKAYYTYEITEEKVPGYSTTIESSEDGFTITITNSRIPFLPDTGGMGTYIFTFIGVVGILAVFYSFRKRKRENEKNV